MSKHFWRNNTLRPRYATKLAKYLAVSMPRAFSGGLPLFERSSVELGPPTTCLWRENSKILGCFMFSLRPHFRGFVRSWEIYLSRAVSMFVYIRRSFSTGFKFLSHDYKPSHPFLPPPPERRRRACSQAMSFMTAGIHDKVLSINWKFRKTTLPFPKIYD